MGININQTAFRSDAPNPTSLRLLTGKEHDREQILSGIIGRFQQMYDMLRQGDEATIRTSYMKNLYRREGMHCYADARGEFMAEVAGIEPTGHLLLRFDSGNVVRYEFKDVKFILP